MDCEKLLEELVNLPTPGTFEDAGQKLVRRRLGELCDRVETDIYGDVLGVVNEKAETRLLLAAHVDEIGLMVSNIDEDGFVQVNLLGGSRPDALVGQRVVIHSARGPVPGVVGRKAGEAPKKQIKVEDLYLDIGASSRAQAARAVKAGDTVTCQCGFARLGGDRVTGRGLDDRAGVVVVLEAMRLIKADRRRPRVAVCALSSVQEEGGSFRGARVSTFRLMPHVALAVDLCHARDYPGMSGRLYGDCKVGGGPTLSVSLTTNRVVNRLLDEAARVRKIAVQHTIEPGATWTDGDAISAVGPGVATGVVSVPGRYMHSPSEVISLKDLKNAARLVAEFALRLPARPGLKPI